MGRYNNWWHRFWFKKHTTHPYTWKIGSAVPTWYTFRWQRLFNILIVITIVILLSSCSHNSRYYDLKDELDNKNTKIQTQAKGLDNVDLATYAVSYSIGSSWVLDYVKGEINSDSLYGCIVYNAYEEHYSDKVSLKIVCGTYQIKRLK